MNTRERIIIAQKVAFGVLAGTTIVQSWAGIMMIKHYERIVQEHTAMRQGSLYLASILDREGIELTEFDKVALAALLKPTKGE